MIKSSICDTSILKKVSEITADSPCRSRIISYYGIFCQDESDIHIGKKTAKER